jgi:adenine-specific DNA-methyltransferase
VFDGKPVFEILHGVTFTGLGLLDRKGADENARITQVATINQQTHFNEAEGGSAMDDKTKDNGAGEAAKKKDGGGGGGFPPADAPGGDKPAQPDLEKENKALKQKVLELQKRIDELEAEQKAAANKSRAQKLVSRLEKQGITLGDEEERESELKRLAGLSDDAFAATEAAWERMVKSRKAEGGKPDTGESQQPEKKESQASAEAPLRSDAGVRPREVDDRKSSLEDQLREGFMAAYKSRVAQNKGDLAVG